MTAPPYHPPTEITSVQGAGLPIRNKNTIQFSTSRLDFGFLLLISKQWIAVPQLRMCSLRVRPWAPMLPCVACWALLALISSFPNFGEGEVGVINERGGGELHSSRPAGIQLPHSRFVSGVSHPYLSPPSLNKCTNKHNVFQHKSYLGPF